MRGKVLSYNSVDGTGLISGDDGQRYGFVRQALQGGIHSVVVGSEVDFQAQNGVAVGVYIIISSPSDKNRFVAALLAFFLGGFGVHKFYLGKTNAGIIMLACGTVGWILVLPGMVNWALSLVEFVIYLVKSDQDFYRDYVVGDRSWL